MSESWRYKTYYKPRVLIETSRVLYPQYQDSVLCLTGAELELLRNLMQYLHRRSTFASEYQKGGYLAPTNAEWDSIEAIVASLEEKLMGCAEFLTLLEDLLVQMTCVCDRTTSLANVVGSLPIYGPTLQPAIDKYIGDGGLQVDDDYGDDTPSSGDRCAIAQLTFWLAFEFTTEIYQPAAEEIVDVLLPLVMVSLATLCGTSVLGIPTGIFLALLWSLIKVDVAGSLMNVWNAILANQDELICAVWRGLMHGARTAQANATEVINEMSGMSALDKVALRLLFTPFVMSLAAKAWANSTAWALANIAAGACDDCEEIVGNDWWALALEPATNTVTLDHPPGSYQDKACWEGYVPAGQVCCGIAYQVKEKVGDCELKCMSAFEADCIGVGLWANTSRNLVNGLYFAVNETNIDHVDCKDRLAPTADTWPEHSHMSRLTGPADISAGFNLGWDCTGSVTIVVVYQIFEGTTPF